MSRHWKKSHFHFGGKFEFRSQLSYYSCMTRRFSYCLPVTSYLLQFWFIKTRAEGQAAGRAGPTIDPAFARPKIERKLRSSNKVFFGEQWLVKPLILRQYWCEKVSSPHKSLLMYSTKLYRDNLNLIQNQEFNLEISLCLISNIRLVICLKNFRNIKL